MIPAADIAIEVENLTKSFGGQQVVRNLSMQVRRGTIYGFLGPNGSGKTTTIRMLCGLLTPDAGRGTCLGFDIRTQADRIKRRAVCHAVTKCGMIRLRIDSKRSFTMGGAFDDLYRAMGAGAAVAGTGGAILILASKAAGAMELLATIFAGF
jgi:ABC-type Na+ transport system ATPase subunit NatA